MPGVYREKVCPKCGVKHRRRGPFCSKTCAYTGTTRPEESKQKMSIAKHKFYNESLEGPRVAALMSSNGLPASEDFAIDIPDIRTLDDYSDILGDFEKGEKW